MYAHHGLHHRIFVRQALEQHACGVRTLGSHDHEVASVDVEDVNQHALTGQDFVQHGQHELRTGSHVPHEVQFVHDLEEFADQIFTGSATTQHGEARARAAIGR